jgi:hypothetical protein
MSVNPPRLCAGVAERAGGGVGTGGTTVGTDAARGGGE